MVMKSTNVYKHLIVFYILYIVYLLHVLAALVAILREMHYNRHITKLFDPKHKTNILNFKT